MGFIENIQSNLRFRVQSARQMLMGGGASQEAQPIERRKEIMRRRREALVSSGHVPKMVESRVSTSNRSRRSTRDDGDDSGPRSEGQEISDGRKAEERPGAKRVEDIQRRQRDQGSQRMKAGRIPSLSEANRGTAKRAKERGFQN